MTNDTAQPAATLVRRQFSVRLLLIGTALWAVVLAAATQFGSGFGLAIATAIAVIWSLQHVPVEQRPNLFARILVPASLAAVAYGFSYADKDLFDLRSYPSLLAVVPTLAATFCQPDLIFAEYLSEAQKRLRNVCLIHAAVFFMVDPAPMIQEANLLPVLFSALLGAACVAWCWSIKLRIFAAGLYWFWLLQTWLVIFNLKAEQFGVGNWSSWVR
jgi:hypothetical protein